MQIFKLTHNNTVIFKGTEEGCLMKLQKSQSNSANHAIKYEGWKVSKLDCTPEEEKEILKADPFHYVECEMLEDIKGLNKYVKVKVLETGEIKEGNINAMLYTTRDKGSIVKIAQSYLSEL